MRENRKIVCAAREVLTLAVLTSSCLTTPDCVLTCPLPLAVAVTVTREGSAGPVEGVFLRVTGAVSSMGPCNDPGRAGGPTVCSVGGYAGTYQLEISAPGFETARRTV